MHTGAGLRAALARGARNIVLADGSYDSAGPFTLLRGSHLYAEHVGRAVLTAGLMIGGGSSQGGAVVRGLAFDVSTLAKSANGAEIDLEGRGAGGANVLDCTFDGHGVIAYGVFALNPSGLVAKRLSFSHFTDVALRASDNIPAAYGGSTPRLDAVTDISVDGVSRATPGSSDGTAESGVWIGEPVVNGVHRIKVRNTAWSGIETVNNAWNTAFTDLDIDMSGSHGGSGVAVYMEHFSIRDTFTRFAITGARVGFNAEWDSGVPGNGAAHDVVISNGFVDATGAGNVPSVGIYLDDGTESTTVRNVRFRGQTFAGIAAHNVTGTNVFSSNTASRLGLGAVLFTTNAI